MNTVPLSIGDYLLAAEIETGVPSWWLHETVPMGRLRRALLTPFAILPTREPLYRSLPEQAAVLAVRLADGRLLPHLDTDVAVAAMVAFLALNDHDCTIAREHRRAVELVGQVVAGERREAELAAWVAERTFPDRSSEESADL